MEIEITKQMIQELGVDKFKSFNIDEDWERYHDNLNVNLESLKEENVKKLLKLLESIKNIRKVKSRIYDINLYLKSVNNDTSVKLYKVNHLRSVLINYLKPLEHHWIFKTSDSDTNVKVAYYVDDIDFHPKVKRSYNSEGHPAYVEIELIYDKLGNGCKKRIKFYDDDVYGKTIVQILMAKGFIVENPELLNIYDKEIKRYEEIFPLVGKQFNIKGAAETESDSWRKSSFSFTEDKSKNKVVIDSLHDDEDEERNNSRSKSSCSGYFWSRYGDKDEDEYDEGIEEATSKRGIVPMHPFVIVFDLSRHLRLITHVTTLTEYIYDDKLADKLVLPEKIKSLITLLVEHKESSFKDIIAGKTGGAIVLLTGVPGVGKTLTAEVFAESEQKPLYSVQASQLGTDPNELEQNLLKILKRSKRWDAIMLLDESDVYIHTRGNDLGQNAIVGVFLRVLEYHASVLFLTTNRPDLVDDAIASRCVARIDYQYPNKEDQYKIWKILSEMSNVVIKDEEINNFIEKNENVSGRDIKNLLKLALLISQSRNQEVDCELLEYVLQFKPTSNQGGKTK